MHKALFVLFVVELGALSWLALLGPIPVPKLFVGYGVAFISYLGALPLLSRSPSRLWVWLLAGFLLRAPWLPAGLSLSDDAWRYLHDGRAQVADVNPYRYPPASPEASSYAGPEREQINNPELPTIYPPAAQLSFRAAIHLGGTLFVWKLLLTLIDLGIGIAVAGILVSRQRPAAGAAIYLLHPLPVLEFAGNGHIDALGILALVASLALLERRRIAAGIAFAVSTAAKYLALPLLPFFARALPNRERTAFLAAAAGTLIIVYLPFLDYPPLGSLGEFVRAFEFNTPLYALLRAITSSLAARAVLATAIIAVMAVVWWRKAPPETAAFTWISAVLLLSPIVHPWYVVWLIPFLAWRKEPWALVWTGSVVLSYAVLTQWRAAEVWHLPTWAAALEYVPVYGLLAIRVVRWKDGKTES